MKERCAKWMPRAQEHCALAAGHRDHCRGGDLRSYKKAYYEANRERLLAYQNAYYESEAGQDSYRRQVESGKQAARLARYRRRKAEERDGKLDHRLETLLGGILCQGNPTT
jgi:hypothetical protein